MTPGDPPDPPRPASARLTLQEIQRGIERLGRDERAALRPWILARYDVRGYRSASTFGPRDAAD